VREGADPCLSFLSLYLPLATAETYSSQPLNRLSILGVRQDYNHGEKRMPAKQLRCGAWVVGERDQTGKEPQDCGDIAVLCVDCNGAAGCVEHAFFCGHCGRAVCDGCRSSHGCQAPGETRAAWRLETSAANHAMRVLLDRNRNE
jgi:hypothetical protein